MKNQTNTEGVILPPQKLSENQKILLAILFLNSAMVASAQNKSPIGKVSGTVLDDNQRPLEFVTITLYRGVEDEKRRVS